MHEWKALLATRPFRAFWLALLANNLGNWCVIATLPILVASRFGAGEELVLSLGLRVLPKIVLAPFAGDLLRRLGATVISGRSLAGLGVLTTLLPWCDSFLTLQILIAAIGTLDVFIMPGILSLRGPVTPPGLEMAGNTLCSVADRLAKFAGPALGGVVLLAGFEPGFLIFGAANLFAGVAVGRLPVMEAENGPPATGWQWARLPLDFLRMLRADPVLVGLLVAAVTYMVMLGGLRPFLFWANRDWYGAVDTAWTGLLAAQGGGALIGALLAALFSARLLRWCGAYRLTLLSGMVEGGLMLTLVFAANSLQAMVILAFASMPELISTATWFTAFQRRLTPRQQAIFFSFAAPLWDVAYMTGVGFGWFYTAGLVPLWGYWAAITLSATVPLLPLMLVRARDPSSADQ